MLWTLTNTPVGCSTMELQKILDQHKRYQGIGGFLITEPSGMGNYYTRMNMVSAYVVWVCDSDLFSEQEKMDLLYYTTLDRIRKNA